MPRLNLTGGALNTKSEAIEPRRTLSDFMLLIALDPATGTPSSWSSIRSCMLSIASCRRSRIFSSCSGESGNCAVYFAIELEATWLAAYWAEAIATSILVLCERLWSCDEVKAFPPAAGEGCLERVVGAVALAIHPIFISNSPETFDLPLEVDIDLHDGCELFCQIAMIVCQRCMYLPGN